MSVWVLYTSNNSSVNYTSETLRARIVFDDEFPPEVDTVFYQKLKDEERVYIFKDGYFWISRYTQKLLPLELSKKVYLRKLQVFSQKQSVSKINDNFPKEIDAIEIYYNTFYVYSNWKYFKVAVNDQWFEVSPYI